MSTSSHTLSALLPLVIFVGCGAEGAESVAYELEDTAPVTAEARIARAGPFTGRGLYVEPDGNAARTADELRDSDPEGAAMMDAVADTPIAMWIGDWLPDAAATVDEAVTVAGRDLQVFVVYSIPNRDCGAWSAGGHADAAAYDAFVADVARGLDGRQAIVVLEPDALGVVECLDDAGRQARFDMLGRAVDTLTAAGGDVYIDAGDSNWLPADEMAERLRAAGVERAAGVALNVSHTELTTDEADYADELRAILGDDVHYVIDTSRNGLGHTEDSEWCNPLGRAHGPSPTLHVRRDGLDALLWIKRPGESDGYCNGGPEAGAWWPEYALELAANAGY